MYKKYRYLISDDIFGNFLVHFFIHLSSEMLQLILCDFNFKDIQVLLVILYTSAVFIIFNIIPTPIMTK